MLSIASGGYWLDDGLGDAQSVCTGGWWLEPEALTGEPSAYYSADVTEGVTPGVAAGLLTFGSPVSDFVFSNRTGRTAYIAFNGTVASAANHDTSLLDGESFAHIVGELGLGTIATVSVWLPTGADAGAFTARGA